MPPSPKTIVLVLLIGLQTPCLTGFYFLLKLVQTDLEAKLASCFALQDFQQLEDVLEYLVLRSEAKPGIQNCIRPSQTPKIAALPSSGSV